MVNDKFDIQGVNSTKINLLIYLVNNNKDNKSINLFDYNAVQIIYNDNIDTLKSDINTNNVSSNLGMINTNKSNISSNLGMINTNKSNISSNLGMINTNKSNISFNLGIINTNKISIKDNDDDIAYNLREMNKIKSNKTYQKTYIIFYFIIKKLKSILGIYFIKKYLILMLIKMIL